MRLTCPNCSAEYEVDASVIPPGGRDVQCSNCDHTWFEGPVGGAPKAISPAAPAPEEENHPSEPARAPRIERPRISRVAAQRAARTDPDREIAPEDVPDFTPPAMGRARKPVDEEVLQVLREEAEREQRVRRGEPVEMYEQQPELALAGSAPRQSRRIPTDPRDLPDEDLVPSGTIGRRRTGDAGRNVLPDIEEINSSLRSSTERPNSVPAYVEVEQTLRKVRRGQGFRLGFSAILMVVSAAMFVYIFSGELATRWPEYAPYIDQFVTQANILRAWLDGVIRDLSNWLTTMITENTG